MAITTEPLELGVWYLLEMLQM